MSEARGIPGPPARTAGGRCLGGLGHGRALEPDAILLAARRQAPGSPTIAGEFTNAVAAARRSGEGYRSPQSHSA